jgi:hypothetical protein
MKKWLYPILIILIFLSQFLFISPVGEFALNDDWVHTDILKHWVDTGDFRMNPFAGPTFYIPILYGAGLTKLFGFSFTVLRISTLFFALLTLLVLFFFLNRVTNKPHLNFFIVLSLWLNPIFYSLSFTFMTDIPALFLIVCSLYAFYKAFDEQKPQWIFAGSLISVLGFFVRQTNILVMVAGGIYATYELIKNIKIQSAYKKNIAFKHLLWSFGIPAMIWSIIYYLLSINHILPDVIGLHRFGGDFAQTRTHIMWWSWYTIIYLGFFVIPFFMSYIFKKPLNKMGNKLLVICIFISALLAGIFKIALHMRFPYISNIIVSQGIGPANDVLRGMDKSLFSSIMWSFIGVFIASSSGYLVYLFTRKKLHEKPIGFMYIFSIIYLIPILLLSSFDRYYLPLYIVIAVLLARHIDSKKYTMPILILCIVTLSIFSVSQTKFYLNWNQTRWNLANEALILSKNTPEIVDGGYEWNGWNAYWSAYDATLQGVPHGRWTGPWWIRSLFVNNTEEYIVSFAPIIDYTILESKKIPGWNPNNTVYLLKKR